MDITRSFSVQASISHVWAITAQQFADVGLWASSVPTSTARPGQIMEAAPVAGRTCAVTVPGASNLEERLVRFEPENHTFAYHVDAGVPWFVDQLISTWELAAVSANQTSVTITVTMSTTGLIGSIARPGLRWSANRTLASVEEDLIHYAETGDVSPKKSRQLQRRH